MNDCLELKVEMVRCRIRQHQVAKLLDISESYLSDILNAVKPVDSDMKRRIRKAIDVLSAEADPKRWIHFPE